MPDPHKLYDFPMPAKASRPKSVHSTRRREETPPKRKGKNTWAQTPEWRAWYHKTTQILRQSRTR